MNLGSANLQAKLADQLASIMFWLSLFFLALIASLLVLWIDIPRTTELLGEGDFDSFEVVLSQDEMRFQAAAEDLGDWVLVILWILWPIFIVEQIANWLLSDNWANFRSNYPFAFMLCLIPPLRLCAKNRLIQPTLTTRWPPVHGETVSGQIWYPVLGWQAPTRAFTLQLERATSIPMIGIALLILPILGLQWRFGEQIINYPTLRIALHIATGVIWFAFATEFIVMVSVTSNKWQYCKKHWLDLVIILLPLISFLRSLRLLRTAKLLNISKLQQLSRIIRVYRLRGVAMRAMRAFLV
ncbi:MAG: hypothetical protein KDB03_25725, partial [Planctomycetales bacterium]|nr:hypothetical protein [Planctomycetales bacterium]